MTSIGECGPGPGAVDLVRLWPAARGRTPTARVRELLVALHGDQVRHDPLGVHHQRALALHRTVVARAIEALVGCANCGTDNEFTVPVAQICALPAPPPDAAVRLAVEGGEARFRLPTVTDLDAVAGSPSAAGARALAARTCLDADPPELAAGEVADADLARLAQAWEALDPAGSVQVDLACAGCGAAVAADVAVAEFVARDLDRAVEGLLRDVDVIARAYGWSEDAILGLPAERRRRYVDLAGRADHPPAGQLVTVPS
jgi:hypothetical protein